MFCAGFRVGPCGRRARADARATGFGARSEAIDRLIVELVSEQESDAARLRDTQLLRFFLSPTAPEQGEPATVFIQLETGFSSPDPVRAHLSAELNGELV